MNIRAEFERFGAPRTVLRVVPDPPRDPGPHEVSIEVLFSPIDPMDLLMVRGLYPLRPPLPAVPGAEGVGRVRECRQNTQLEPGSLVLLPIRCGAWRSRLNVTAADLLRLPSTVDPIAASTLRINAVSADALLQRARVRSGDDCIVHAPAAGSVGQYLAQIGAGDPRLVHVVRRIEGAALLRQLGAQHVLVDGPDLADRIRALIDRPVAVVIDGVGGPASTQLVGCLDDGGHLIAYGAMAKRPLEIPVGPLVFRGITIEGWWLNAHARRVGQTKIDARILELAAAGLKTKICEVIGLEDLDRALEVAEDPDRRGRVLLSPSPT